MYFVVVVVYLVIVNDRTETSGFNSLYLHTNKIEQT